MSIINYQADQGNYEAQFNVGYLSDTGKGIKKDLKKAFEYYKLAADQGYAGANN